MKKIFRILKNDLACPEAFHPLWFRIEQRYTLLFFFHWWGTPTFEPPHNFEHDYDALKYIKEHCPNSIVYSLFVQNTWKPSEEQIKALELSIIGFVPKTDPALRRPLNKLLEQLKKL